MTARAAGLLINALDENYPDDISFTSFRDGATGTNNFIPEPRVDDPTQGQQLNEVWEGRKRGLLEQFQQEKKLDQTFYQWAIANSGLGGDPDLNDGRKALSHAIKSPGGDYHHVFTERMKTYLNHGVGEIIKHSGHH